MQPSLLSGLRAFVDLVHVAVTIVDQTGRVVEWNPAAERMYNIKRSEIIGEEITGFFAPSSLMVRQVLESGTPLEPTYHQPRHGIHVLVSATPLFADGQLVGALAAERDVTHMVKLSEELIDARGDGLACGQGDTNHGEPPSGAPDPFSQIKGQNGLIRHVIDLARRIAPTDAVTMIRGESGVGKELFAEAIHRASLRSKGPFIALNCGAIPDGLFESELFGYAPGAFTGANPKGQPGKLELADAGTLFLDEVGDLPIESQVKLLRVLEGGTYFRIAGMTSISVDVRLIIATNRPLEKMVQQGTFREDLYWRLNVVTLTLPALRDRKEDIFDLAQLYVHHFGLKHGRPISSVHPEVMRSLLAYNWPGNVRELRNTMERLVLFSTDGTVGIDIVQDALRSQLPDQVEMSFAGPSADNAGNSESVGGERSLQVARGRVEREEILAALQSTWWNRAAAARLLGISRGTMYYKCRHLGIDLQNHS
jgi:PAS domain S-box-containing protein